VVVPFVCVTAVNSVDVVIGEHMSENTQNAN